MPSPQEFAFQLFSLLGVPIPEDAVGSAVPLEEEDLPPALREKPCVCQAPPQHHFDLDPDLVNEILEAKADRLLFEEDC